MDESRRQNAFDEAGDPAIGVEDAVISRVAVRVKGVVRGVGFRPFVRVLARRHGLSGWVQGSGADIVLEVEGAAVPRFLHDLHRFAPPLARIDSLNWRRMHRRFDSGFVVLDDPVRRGDLPPPEWAPDLAPSH